MGLQCNRRDSAGVSFILKLNGTFKCKILDFEAVTDFDLSRSKYQRLSEHTSHAKHQRLGLQGNRRDSDGVSFTLKFLGTFKGKILGFEAVTDFDLCMF